MSVETNHPAKDPVTPKISEVVPFEASVGSLQGWIEYVDWVPVVDYLPTRMKVGEGWIGMGVLGSLFGREGWWGSLVVVFEVVRGRILRVWRWWVEIWGEVVLIFPVHGPILGPIVL